MTAYPICKECGAVLPDEARRDKHTAWHSTVITTRDPEDIERIAELQAEVSALTDQLEIAGSRAPSNPDEDFWGRGRGWRRKDQNTSAT